MWLAFIRGITDHLPNAQITFDKFHVISHASTAISDMRRKEQKTDPDLKGMRWVLLKDHSKLTGAQRNDLDALLTHMTTIGLVGACGIGCADEGAADPRA
jgi:transposase